MGFLRALSSFDDSIDAARWKVFVPVERVSETSRALPLELHIYTYIHPLQNVFMHSLRMEFSSLIS